MTRWMNKTRERAVMGHPLRQWRDREGLSRAAMARRRGAGFSEHVIVKWELWDRLPNVDNQRSLRIVIGAQADHILKEWFDKFDDMKGR